jgi:hypothetical protein
MGIGNNGPAPECQIVPKFVPLHILPGIGAWSAKFRVQIVYIIVYGFVWSVATTQ